MAKTSYNISDRLFVTINHNDNTASIGTLGGPGEAQKILVKLTLAERDALHDVLSLER